MGPKSPLLAAVLSVLIPGVGHFYCGAWPRGLFFAFLAVVAYAFQVALGVVGTAVVLAVDAWAAYDAWTIAKALPAVEAAEDAAPFARTKLHWVWALMRAAWISAFLLGFGGFGFSSFAWSLRANHWSIAAFILAPTLLLCVLSWLAARSTWRVMQGTENMSRGAVRNEVGATIFFVGLAGLMLAIVWPSFSGIYRKSAEGDMKGGLATIRDAFARYRAERSENPPSLEALVESKHLAALPRLWPKNSGIPHPQGNGTIILPERVPTDSGRWAYAAGFTAPVFIDCTHTDTRGNAWASY